MGAKGTGASPWQAGDGASCEEHSMSMMVGAGNRNLEFLLASKFGVNAFISLKSIHEL
jgi:hypothetical protein